MSCFEGTSDEALHYSDGSHDWIAPPGVDQTVWEAGMRAHLDRHERDFAAPTFSPGVRRVSVAATKPVTWP